MSALKSVPTTVGSSDMTSVLAEIDAAMARSAASEDAEAEAQTAATSADRETAPSSSGQAAAVDTTRRPDPNKSPALVERDTATRPAASGISDIGEARAKRSAEAPQPDPAEQAVASGAEFRSRLHWFIGAADVRSQDPGSLTYEPYFGLREKPFSLSSDPRFFFSYSSHGAAFDTLAAGVRRREGLLVLTGEVGTGKTTLCRAVLQSLDQKTFAAFVPDPFLSREDLLTTLLVDFGVVSVDEIRSGRLRGASRAELSYSLYDFLLSLQPLNAFAVVMIDEAQNLTAELLEEIRILSDLEKGQKLLEVVLVGQPELRARLATSTMRQLSQRVSVRCELSPLARQDVARYVSHRLTIAGNDGRVQFTDGAIEFVWAASNGTPRVINLVCDRALSCAARSRTMSVTGEHVVWAVDDLKLPVSGTFDQARALESFPEEPAEAPAADPEDPIRQPQGPASLPVFDAVETGSGGLGLGVEPSPISDWLDTDYAKPVLGGPADDARESSLPNPLARTLAFTVDFAAARQRRRRRALTLVGVCLALALMTALAWYWYLTAQHRLPHQAPPGQAANLSTTPGGPNAAAPGGAFGDVALPARAGDRTESQDPVSPTAPGFALQMATFQSAARAAQAVQEFRDAGYNAYGAERSLRDGTVAHAVFLGPYTERAAAEGDRERASQIPGYGTGLIVPLGPAVPSQKTQ